MDPDAGGEFAQDSPALAGRHIAPDLETGSGRGDNRVDILDPRLGHIAQKFARTRIAALGAGARRGRPPGASVVEVEPARQHQPGRWMASVVHEASSQTSLALYAARARLS